MSVDELLDQPAEKVGIWMTAFVLQKEWQAAEAEAARKRTGN